MNAEQLWKEFIKMNPTYEGVSYDTFSFGNTDEMADELEELVKNGEKTATSSGYCFYEMEGEELPKAGKLSIVLNAKDEAECVILMNKVYVIPFNEVSGEHAYKEGEGDRSLAYWRERHQNFFTEVLAPYEVEFDEHMLIVCEEFETIWK